MHSAGAGCRRQLITSTMQVALDGAVVIVHIERKRIRNMYLRVAEDGSLKVTCGYSFRDSDIERFIQERKHWIEKQQVHVHRTSIINQEGLNRDEIYWLGEKKKVLIKEGSHDACMVDGDWILFTLITVSEERMQKAFRRSAVVKINELISEYRGQWDEQICEANHLPVPEITVRYMTSCWGLCKPSKAHITMSTRLIHYPVESFEYVLLHEYVHFLVQNHSKKFYTIVERYMPEYKNYDRFLK